MLLEKVSISVELVRINYPHSYTSKDFPPLALALGYFDGVHLGHQQVIAEAQASAQSKGLRSAVMTFDPHPSVVLGKTNQQLDAITPLSEKIHVMEGLGIDYLFIVHFTQEFSSLLPQEFIDKFIIGLNVKHVVAGFDYRYGKMGKGTMETLPFHSRDLFSYTVVPKLETGGEKVSSTLIRSLIRQGTTGGLPSLLGRFYTTTGIVVGGDKRGRTIGFPTANIDHSENYIIPPVGVYAVKVLVRGTWHNGVCNIGYKPTFNKERPDAPTVEVHIFDFNHEIYGDEVTIEWHIRLRSEQKFNGISELVEQIDKDKQEALLYFEKNNC